MLIVKNQVCEGGIEETTDLFSTPFKSNKNNNGTLDSSSEASTRSLRFRLHRSPDVFSVTSMSSMSLASDAQLDGMPLIFQKELPKISVDRYYETFWSEETNGFYKSWLAADGKTDITIEAWKEAKGDVERGLVNPYDKENYDQMRTLTYSYSRSTPVYSGPVKVTVTQYCRRIRVARCVVSSTLQFSGMPYSQAFEVHVRWVASRRHKVNLRIQVAACVVMLEQVLVASQIKANTMNEMAVATKSLYIAMKQTLGYEKAHTQDSKTPLPKQGPSAKHWIKFIFPFMVPPNKNDALIKVREAQFKLQRLRALAKKKDDQQQQEQKQDIVHEMDAVHEALDAILLRKYSGSTTTDVAALSSSSSVASKEIRSTNNFHILGDGLLKALCTRKIKVRDPAMFQKKVESAPVDLQRRDKPMRRMEAILSSTIPDASLVDFANVFLTDEQGQDGFYANWLRESDRENVEISCWKNEDQLQSLIVDDFSGESFTLHRQVDCTFNRAKFLRDESALSVVSKQTQEQFYRMEANKRLVFCTTTTIENVPFSDTFQVHIRWVVTQLRMHEISVKVGLFVAFKTQAYLEPRIRTGTAKEARRTQLDLFLKVRAALEKVHEQRTLAQQKALAEYLTPTPRICDILPSSLQLCKQLDTSDLVESDEAVNEEFENAKLKLRAAELFFQESEATGDSEAINFMLFELNVVNDALDNIKSKNNEKLDSPQSVVSSDLPHPVGFRNRDFATVASISSFSLAPDAQLDGMPLAFQKELPKISVDRYYRTFWREETNGFYESWLAADGKTDITIGPWREGNDDKGGILNPYDQETYDQMRTLTYSYHRSTSVYSGLVTVTMTQYCRHISLSRCVVSSTLQFSGMPYSHAFEVHIRWVASRRQKVNLRIQVGVCVVMLEQVVVASQIKANTMNEMTTVAQSLYRAMKQTLGYEKVNLQDSKTLQKQVPSIEHWLKIIFPIAAASTKNDSLIKVREAQLKLRRLRAFPQKEDDRQQQEQKEIIVHEMDAVHEALDAILLRKYALTKTGDALWSSSSACRKKTKVTDNFHNLGDGVMRALNHRTIQVRDPAMFQKKVDSEQIHLQRRDKALSNMEVIVSSTIEDASISEFVNVLLTDEQGQNGFYANWLRESDRENVEISCWKNEDQLRSPVVDDFSGESFTYRRQVECKFNKAKFLRDGSAQSVVSRQTQEQYYRIEEADKRLVFCSTTTVENVPFADAFQVHIRWVVAQSGMKALSVKVGLFVTFKKQALLEPKIRAGTTKEARRTQLDLFLKVRGALGKVHEQQALAQQKALAEYLTPTPWICDILPPSVKLCTALGQRDLVESDETLYEEFENAKLKLRGAALFLQGSEATGDLEAVRYILFELNVVNDALDNIAEWHGVAAPGGSQFLSAASFQ